MVDAYIENVIENLIIKKLKALNRGEILYSTHKSKGVNRLFLSFSSGKLKFTFETDKATYVKSIPEAAIVKAIEMQSNDITYNWLRENYKVNPGNCVICVLRRIVEL